MPVSHQCLIVARNESRVEMFVSAALDGGWRTIVCADPDDAIAECERFLIQLAVVDMQESAIADSNQLWLLLEYLAGIADRLVVVCGHGDSDEEIRCRELGAWLFLTGVNNRDDLAQVLAEANRIVLSRELNAHRWLAAT